MIYFLSPLSTFSIHPFTRQNIADVYLYLTGIKLVKVRHCNANTPNTQTHARTHYTPMPETFTSNCCSKTTVGHDDPDH